MLINTLLDRRSREVLSIDFNGNRIRYSVFLGRKNDHARIGID